MFFFNYVPGLELYVEIVGLNIVGHSINIYKIQITHSILLFCVQVHGLSVGSNLFSFTDPLDIYSQVTEVIEIGIETYISQPKPLHQKTWFSRDFRRSKPSIVSRKIPLPKTDSFSSEYELFYIFVVLQIFEYILESIYREFRVYFLIKNILSIKNCSISLLKLLLQLQ